MFSKSGMTLRDCPNLLLKFSLSGTFLSYPFCDPMALCEKCCVCGCLTFPHSHSRGRYVREPITGVSAVFSIICVALQLYRCTIIIKKQKQKTQQLGFMIKGFQIIILSSRPYHHPGSGQKLPAPFKR